MEERERCYSLVVSRASHEIYYRGIVFDVIFSGMQVYLLMLLWSLLKKWEVEGPHVYENQLQQFIEGQVKGEANGVYNPSTEPVQV
jgi:hypothetical protein